MPFSGDAALLRDDEPTALSRRGAIGDMRVSRERADDEGDGDDAKERLGGGGSGGDSDSGVDAGALDASPGAEEDCNGATLGCVDALPPAERCDRGGRLVGLARGARGRSSTISSTAAAVTVSAWSSSSSSSSSSLAVLSSSYPSSSSLAPSSDCEDPSSAQINSIAGLGPFRPTPRSSSAPFRERDISLRRRIQVFTGSRTLRFFSKMLRERALLHFRELMLILW